MHNIRKIYLPLYVLCDEKDTYNHHDLCTRGLIFGVILYLTASEIKIYAYHLRLMKMLMIPMQESTVDSCYIEFLWPYFAFLRNNNLTVVYLFFPLGCFISMSPLFLAIEVVEQSEAPYLSVLRFFIKMTLAITVSIPILTQIPVADLIYVLSIVCTVTCWASTILN